MTIELYKENRKIITEKHGEGEVDLTVGKCATAINLGHQVSKKSIDLSTSVKPQIKG